jgi:hypothetical protein
VDTARHDLRREERCTARTHVARRKRETGEMGEKSIKVPFGSQNVSQMVTVMVCIRLPAVTNLNRLVSISSVVSDYGWT